MEILGFMDAELMIVLKLPDDAAEHPYMLVDIVASSGSRVSKGDPIFKLSRAGSQSKITFRAPVDGTIGRYMVVAGTDLLGDPGQHIVTMERAEVEEGNPPAQSADGLEDISAVAVVEMHLPNDAELLPARIDAWLVAVGDDITLGQSIAQVTLADGRQLDLTSKATGRLEAIAAGQGEYITQMQRLCCTIVRTGPKNADGQVDLTPKPSSPPASKASPKPVTFFAMGPDAPANYPMQLVEWHVEEGDFIAKGQVAMTLKRASGHASFLRSVETGRVISTNVSSGTKFGIDEVLYVISTTEKPPVGWTTPPDPSVAAASQKPATKGDAAPENNVAEVEASALKARQKTRGKIKEEQATSPVMAALVLLVPIGVSMSYLFTGSRTVGIASTFAVLMLMFAIAKRANIVAISSILVVMMGALLVAPQDVVLPAKISPWEPFGIGVLSPNGALHGDIWENITRPRPTKQEQARFDAWLEE